MAVTYERLESVALITLDRPTALNAINAELSRELREAWERFNEEDEALVAVLTGSGRAFCAGLDMKEAAEAARTGRPLQLGRGVNPRDVVKPTIAAVNGACAGGGVSFALGCDIILCAENAQFVLPFAARGRGGGPVALQVAQRTSINAALYMALTAGRISAEQALRMGLVQEVLPSDDLLPRAIELAEKIAGHSQISVRALKAHLWNAMEVGIVEAMQDARTTERDLETSGDTREGTLAFDEKRRPQFQSRA
jgi:enoyl-CoA hydratase/carnithine racemase